MSSLSSDPLDMWLALELRRTRAAFDSLRKEQDADVVAKAGERCGPRVKLVLRLASQFCVALADATIAKSIELKSSNLSFGHARQRVQSFTRELANVAIPLAYFVGDQSPRSVVTAATKLGNELCQDIEGAFILAEATRLSSSVQGPHRSPAVKAGRPPSDDEILAKAEEMKACGKTGYDIAATMRFESGFDNVATTHVRELIRGRWKGGRPHSR